MSFGTGAAGSLMQSKHRREVSMAILQARTTLLLLTVLLFVAFANLFMTK